MKLAAHLIVALTLVGSSMAKPLTSPDSPPQPAQIDAPEEPEENRRDLLGETNNAEEGDDPESEGLSPDDPTGPSSWQPWYEKEEEAPKERRGFTVSLAGSGGAIAGIDGWDGAIGVAFFFGWQFDERLTAGIEWTGLSHGPVFGSPEYTLGVLGPALRYWATPRLWLSGGVAGAGMTQADPTGETSGREVGGFAISGAMGYQVIQWPSAGMDVALRASSFILDGEEAGTFSLNVGTTFF